jgi:hypothetical protein
MSWLERRRVGVVGFDYRLDVSADALLSLANYDTALRLLDDEGCDTVLFTQSALEAPVEMTAEDRPPFGELRSVDLVVNGLASGPEMAAWRRAESAPTILQPVDFSAKRKEMGPTLVERLPERTFDSALLLFGGELNAFVMRKAEESGVGFDAPAGWIEYLRSAGVGLILNPAATYMRRWEMKRKRAFCSEPRRTVISVWNRTTLGESARQWTVFHDGDERSGSVERMVDLGDVSPRLVVGILDVPVLARHGTAP